MQNTASTHYIKGRYLNHFISSYIFSFQLQLTFYIIFRCYNIMVRYLHNLWRDLPGKASTQLAPYIVTTVLLAILQFTFNR